MKKKGLLCLCLLILLFGCNNSNTKDEKDGVDNISEISIDEDKEIKVYLYSLMQGIGVFDEVSYKKNITDNTAKDYSYTIELKDKVETPSSRIFLVLSKDYKPISISYRCENDYNLLDIERFSIIVDAVFDKKLINEIPMLTNITFDENSEFNEKTDDLLINVSKGKTTNYTAEKFDTN